MSRGKHPIIRYYGATAEGGVIDGNSSLPWELSTVCIDAIDNLQMDAPSESCTEINFFIIGTEIPEEFRSDAILLLGSRELLVVTDRTACGNKASMHQSAFQFQPLLTKKNPLLVSCICSGL